MLISHKTKLLTLALILLPLTISIHAAVPQVINYQGYLTDGAGTPVLDGTYSIVFAVYDSETLGEVKWTETQNSVQVMDGRFNLLLGTVVNIEDTVFNSESRWLGISVNGDPEMTPRMRFASAPYSHRVNTVDGASGGKITSTLEMESAPGQTMVRLGKADSAITIYNPDGDGVISITYGIDGGGAISIATTDKRLGGAAAGAEALNRRVLIGNSGIYFLDQNATDTTMIINADGSIEGKGKLAMGQNVSNDGSFANVLGFNNNASGDSSVVSGGYDNSATGFTSTVGGGHNNSANGDGAMIGGGGANEASEMNATVGGGWWNKAQGQYSTISGGNANQANSTYSTVPGGYYNRAGGYCSFAAGYRAIASYAHSFVWSDGNDFDFISGTSNEFAARATGGVRFVTAIDGSGNPTAGVQVAAGGGSWSSISDRNLKENFEEIDKSVLLDKLSKVPITRWNYKSQDESIRHIGLMAQDFHAAFKVGEDDTHITTIDADGISIAAIQALYDMVKALQSENEELRKESARIDALESKVAELSSQLHR